MFNLSDATYDFLNKFQRWLPTIGVLYLGLCHIWGLPFGDEVNQTIAVLATFLASYLEICTGQYQKSMIENSQIVEILEGEDDEEETYG